MGDAYKRKADMLELVPCYRYCFVRDTALLKRPSFLNEKGKKKKSFKNSMCLYIFSLVAHMKQAIGHRPMVSEPIPHSVYYIYMKVILIGTKTSLLY